MLATIVIVDYNTTTTNSNDRLKALENKSIAMDFEAPVMILDVTSKKSYKECREYIEKGQDFSTSHISLINYAIVNGYEIVVKLKFKGEDTVVNLHEWIEYLEVNYIIDDYSYEEILQQSYHHWVTGFEI